MFSRTTFVIFCLIFIVFGYLFYLNPDEVVFTLYEENYLSLSPALIAFGAFVIGAFFVFLVTLFVDTKRAFLLWRSSKQLKREEVLRERYGQALEQMMKGNVKQAKEAFAKILEKEPRHFASYLSLANLHHLEGAYSEAIDLLIKARTIDAENLELLFDLVKNYVAVNDYPLALETLNHILEKDPANREALRKKRDLYLKQGDWSEAYEAQKSVVKHSKEKDQAAAEKKILLGMEYKLGQELAREGNFKEAEKALREIIKEDHDFVPAQVALGDVLQRQGEPDDAGQLWLRAYESTANPVFLERLESLYLSMANPKRILQLYLDFLKKRPEDTALRFFYSRLLVRLEMIDEALEQLREMELSGIYFPELSILMGQAFHRRGDSGRAIEAYEKALDSQKMRAPAYLCSACGQAEPEWTGFCRSCHSWGTFTISLPQASQVLPAIPFYSYPLSG
jgi:lipopolysaccharide biosynthesis regulator YciM